MKVTNFSTRYKKNSVAITPQAKYTDRLPQPAKLVPIFRLESVHGQRNGSLKAVNLGFLYLSRYFLFQVAPQSSSRS
jgi:hypothetical protein